MEAQRTIPWQPDEMFVVNGRYGLVYHYVGEDVVLHVPGGERVDLRDLFKRFHTVVLPTRMRKTG